MNPWLYLVIPIALYLLLKMTSLRKEVIWFSLLLSPLFIIKPLLLTNLYQYSSSSMDLWSLLGGRYIVAFSIGIIIASGYERFLHHIITPQHHPHRNKLLILIVIPFVQIGAILYGLNITWVTLIAIVSSLIITILIRLDLIWDYVFSGTTFGIVYLLLYALLFSGIPGDVINFWIGNGLSGVNFLSLPIEELFIVFLFGMIWGPIYVAIKDTYTKTTSQ